MKYDFTSRLDRFGMDAIAVSPRETSYFPPFEIREGFDLIPMWVADMNFPVPASITDAIIKRASHPAFGYFRPRQEYYDSIIRWHETRNGAAGLKEEHIGYHNGVLGGVLSALGVLCSAGEHVLVHAPTYVGFLSEVANAGYRLVRSNLVKDADGIWRMDLMDMEEKIRKYNIHTMIFCSPHNPTGRVWTQEELKAAYSLFQKYDVYVISDEIWSDLILDGRRHIPLQSVSEDARNRTVAFYAPSKTFNLAGLVGSYHIIYNDYLRERIKRQSSLSAYNSMNVLSMHALIGAYQKEGEAWLQELLEVLTGNIHFAVHFIRGHFPGVDVSIPQGTYMLFLDCKGWLEKHDMTIDELLKAGMEVGVIWQDGRLFNWPDSIRMNLALPRSRVEEAFNRLEAYVFQAARL